MPRSFRGKGKPMKKTLALLLTLLLCCGLSSSWADTVVSAPDAVPGALSELTVSWKPCGDYLILIANWQQDGAQWEACLTGLPEELSDSQVRLLLSAAVQGKGATVTGDGLIDVEKATNKLPLSYGTKLIQDEISKEYYWGDSKHCWAASVSNMLELTGWLPAAVEPDTGRSFTDEDDLFGFFNRAFINFKGAYQAAALEWAFTGRITRDMESPVDFAMGKLFPQSAGMGVWRETRARDCVSIADVDAYMTRLNQTLRLLKEGAALGGAINLCSPMYPVKSDPDRRCSYDPLMKGFVDYDVVSISQSKVKDSLFVPNPENGMPIPVVYEESTDCYTELESGLPVDANEVWKSELVYDEEQGCWYNLDMPGDEETDAVYFRLVKYDIDEMDMEHPKSTALLEGGGHAVTVMGYVMDLSEKAPAGRIKAIFLADSDNDASFFRPNASTPRREDRPNTYTMYPTRTIPLRSSITEEYMGETISLEGYLPYCQTLLPCVAALMPPSDVPQTGDDFPVGLCAAALAAVVCAAVLCCRGRRKA